MGPVFRYRGGPPGARTGRREREPRRCAGVAAAEFSSLQQAGVTSDASKVIAIIGTDDADGAIRA